MNLDKPNIADSSKQPILPHEISVVLFDLGNVLVDLGDKTELNEMLGAAGDEAEIWLRWLQSPLVKAFDTGKIFFQTFAQSMLDEVPLTGDVDAFKQRFSAWPKGLFDGALTLVRSVKPAYHRAILSNTNAAHWPRLMQEMGLAGEFQSYFASHQMGVAKPDKAIYLSVIEQLSVAPQAILFIDDNQINVDAALACGMQAHRVKGVDQARAVLAQYDVLASLS